MIISRTPFRISFFGGGTDFPDWYINNNGNVISTTINKYCYINIRKLPPFFNYKYNLRYSNIETVNKINEIKHPSIKHCLLNFKNINHGLEIVHNADIPGSSGIGSSSAFTVGLLHCLYFLSNNIPSKKELALKAINIEQEKIKENVGSQDQTAVAFGGLNNIFFSKEKKIEVKPIPISFENLEKFNKSLVIFFTGFTRNSSIISEEFIKNIPKNRNALNEIASISYEAMSIFKNNKIDLKKMGKLLNETWKIKKKLSSLVSNNFVEDVYLKGIKLGAYGGKLMGAGGGGFVLFVVDPKYRENFINNFSNLLHVPIKIDTTGSQIVYYSREEL
jgi:D-glycero-alpha-D-manno-heptose-7-phosphate kinase